jgi:ketosteroid isomerase-like protein
MSASDNKQTIRNNFEQLAFGNGAPLLDSLADDVQWKIIGTTVLSKTLNGKQAVIDELLVPFREALVEGHIHIHVDNLLADGDYVVVQGRGEAGRSVRSPSTSTPNSSRARSADATPA